ncbi:MAG: hypothetical protein L6V78_03740 [Clostridium sp.]|nr:MAG: hypothetical protein L6V78_03740 [Clostridium sp.]
MPRLPNGSTEKAKYYKTQISENYQIYKKNYATFDKEVLINNLRSTKSDAKNNC